MADEEMGMEGVPPKEPLADPGPREEPGGEDTAIRPEDATPEPGVEPPEPGDEPDPDRVVEDKGQDD